MASFEEKVEALRRLRERRQAAAQTPAEDCISSSTCKDSADDVDKRLDGQELTSVLEHYAAGAREPVQTSPASEEEKGQEGAFKQGGDEADALYCLGHCLEQGMHECGEDKAKAAEYYRMAAEKGSTAAQWRLGHLHEFGEGVEHIGLLAAHWYRLAAEAGHAHAQSSLGLLLEEGRAGTHNYAEALRWHLAAAAQGNALSQYCAACCLAEGRGAERDEVTSRSLLEKSAAAGFPLAAEALAKGSMWNHTEAYEDLSDDAMEGSLLDIAARVAKQMEHLSDTEADAFLEELMGNLDDTSALGADELQEALAAGRLPLGIDGGLDAPVAPVC